MKVVNMLNKCSKQDFISITLLVIVAEMNGLSKTLSLTTFLQNFMGLGAFFFFWQLCASCSLHNSGLLKTAKAFRRELKNVKIIHHRVEN